MAFPRRVMRPRGTKRETSWDDIVPLKLTIGPSTAVLAASADATLKAKRPFTIIRTHIEVLLISDQQVATEQQGLALGMCVVSDQAEAIGVSAVPTPSTDSKSDLWFLHQWMFSSFVFSDATGIDASGGRVYTIDSKAARKVNDDEDLIVVVETPTILSGVTLVLAGRILIKEH